MNRRAVRRLCRVATLLHRHARMETVQSVRDTLHLSLLCDHREVRLTSLHAGATVAPHQLRSCCSRGAPDLATLTRPAPSHGHRSSAAAPGGRTDRRHAGVGTGYRPAARDARTALPGWRRAGGGAQGRCQRPLLLASACCSYSRLGVGGARRRRSGRHSGTLWHKMLDCEVACLCSVLYMYVTRNSASGLLTL